MFEDPNSSNAAKVKFYMVEGEMVSTFGVQVLVIVSSLFLLASIFMLILSTVPEFQVAIISHYILI